MDLLTSLFGWLALPVVIARFQLPGMRPLLAGQVATGALMGLHYLLSDLTSAALIAFTAGITAGLQLVLRRRLSLRARLCLATPSILLCCLLVAGPRESALGLMPVLGFAFARISEAQEDDFLGRLIFLASSLTWLIYLVLAGSLPGIAFESLSLASNLFGLWRFHRGRDNDRQKTDAGREPRLASMQRKLAQSAQVVENQDTSGGFVKSNRSGRF